MKQGHAFKVDSYIITMPFKPITVHHVKTHPGELSTPTYLYVIDAGIRSLRQRRQLSIFMSGEVRIHWRLSLSHFIQCGKCSHSQFSIATVTFPAETPWPGFQTGDVVCKS